MLHNRTRTLQNKSVIVKTHNARWNPSWKHFSETCYVILWFFITLVKFEADLTVFCFLLARTAWILIFPDPEFPDILTPHWWIPRRSLIGSSKFPDHCRTGIFSKFPDQLGPAKPAINDNANSKCLTWRRQRVKYLPPAHDTNHVRHGDKHRRHI